MKARPIKPITDEELKIAELPQNFNREDIGRLNESKRVLYEDNERYIAEHKNDPQYQIPEEPKVKKQPVDKNEKELERVRKELAKRKK